MSDLFAEATVVVTPSLTGFVKDLDSELKEAMKKVKTPVVRVAPGLERGFIGNLRNQVNDAVTRVQSQVKPIRVRVLIDSPSRRALQEVVSGAPVTVPGVVGGAAGGVDRSRRIAALEAQAGAGASLGLAAAEEKVTKARERGTAASKKRQVQETATAKAIRLVNQVTKDTALIDFKAATRKGELAQAQFALAESIRVADLADQARAANVTKTTVATQAAAHAERQRRLEIVQTLEAQGAGPAAAASGLSNAQRQARATGVSSLRQAVELERAAAIAFAETGNNVKDLAKQKDILAKRTDALTAANKAATASGKAESDTLRVASLATQARLKTQVETSKELVKNLKEQETAANRAARAEKRRSEQLSRGGQASILSLAGIRGATLAASRSFLAGAAAVTVFANAVRQFADLERNLHVFEATTSATHEEMEAVREEARLLGADLTLPSVTAEEAAGAMVELAKAGLSVTDSINAARAVLELATAAAIDNAEATRLVANVLNAFSLAGTDATAVADTLANAANAAQGSIADIGTAFQQAASAGRQVGLSFQDTAAFLTILAQNGIRGSDAGTSLRTALIRLINPSKNARAAFKELGLEIHDAVGNLRPDIFLQIAQATKEMAPAQRDATIALIGGQDAFRAVTILGRQNVDTFIALRKELRQTGTAAELAAARTKGLHGSIDALQSILETVGTTMASHVGPGIAGFVYELGRGVTALSESNTLAQALEQTLTGIAGGFNILAQSIKVVGSVLIPVTNLLLKLVNALGVPTILAGIAAYKILGGTVERVTKSVKAAQTAWAALGTAQAAAALSSAAASGLVVVKENMKEMDASTMAATRSTGRFGVALRAVTSVVNPYLLAIGAVAAGLTFLIRRQTEAEKATKNLAKATDEFARATSRLREARSAAGIAETSVSSAELALMDAQIAAINARNDAQRAPVGSQARERALLLAKVATDDIAAAQQRLNEALEREEDLRLEALQARAASLRARDEQVESIERLVRASQDEDIRGAPGTRADQQARAVQRLTDALSKQAVAAREAGDADSIRLAERLEILTRLAAAIGELPDAAIQIAIEAESPRQALAQLADEFATGGAEARRRFIAEISGKMAAEAAAGIATEISRLKAIIAEFFGQIGEEAGGNFSDRAALGIRIRQAQIEQAAQESGKAAAAAFAAALQRSEFRQANLATQENLAIIASGATGATLPVLEQRLAQAQADQARAEARIAELQGTGQKRGLARARKARADAIARQADIIQEIRGINQSLASEAAAAAKDAESKQNKIFDDLLKAMGIKREAQEQRIENAELTEGLADNIKQTQILRNIAQKQIAALKARIKNARAQGKDVSILIEGLRDLKELWRDLGRELVDLRKEQAAAIRERVFTRFELRLRIAEAREDVAAQIRIRRQRLEVITRELSKLKNAGKKNTIAWLELKAQQAEEIAAIKDLNEQLDDKKEAQNQMQFKFLQMQTGFVANLLGNLIPGGIGAGELVGGTIAGGPIGGGAPPGQFPSTGIGGFPVGFPGIGDFKGKIPSSQKAAAAKAAGEVSGPTRGGQSRELHLLEQILRVLREIKTGRSHPDAKYVQATGGGGGNQSEAL